MSLPNLAGVVTKDLVETIGTGSFKAQYVNWSRTMNLLREHAPGWMPEVVPTEDGSLAHRDPVGGHIRIKFRHIDGRETPYIPQAVMDHRNAAIPFDKITSRDVTDTHRRGICLAANMFFGLAYELWAKMPLESGYSEVVNIADVPDVKPVQLQQTRSPELTKEDFMEAALSKGLTTFSIESLLEKVKTNYANGIKTLNGKTAEWVEAFNQQNQPEEVVSPVTEEPKTRAKKSPAKPSPDEY